MPSGIIVVDKPQGWTSMDVCAKLRRVLGERRVGHAGTLDPMATGVLPVFVGRATRAVEFAESGEKEYIATLRLGQVTDTQDVTGTVLEEHPVTGGLGGAAGGAAPIHRGHFAGARPCTPRLKQDGKKLYELARQGKTVERQPRPITIFGLEVLEQQSGRRSFCCGSSCSKGTYIRTLCHDIGAALGCGGTMATLRRTMAAGFDLSQAVTMEQILSAENAPALLLRWTPIFGTTRR